MFFATIFDIFMPIKKERIPAMKIVITIYRRFVCVRDFRISFSATAAPERVLPMLYKAMKLREITIVFIAPVRKRKERLSCLKSSEPRVAAWPEPMPGRNEQSGAEIAAAREDFKNCFFVSLIFLRGESDCFGRADD